MKLSVDWIERYPDYMTFTDLDRGAFTIKLTDEEYAEWLRVDKAYGEWQAKFHSLRKARV
jgi:hypothetical protein